MGSTRLLRSRAASLALAIALAASSGACDRRSPRGGAPSAGARLSSSRAAPSSTPPRPSASSADTSSPSARRPEPSPEPDDVREARRDGGLPHVALEELSDVGPAGPATATAEGVVMVTKSDEVERAVARGPIRKGRIGSVRSAAAAFAVLARPPSVANGYAHWISQGRLVRRRADGTGELDVLADHARNGARVSAVAVEGGTAIAYLGRPDTEGASHALLRVDAQHTLDVTPDGAGASSVSLVALGTRLLVVAIDGRTGMTPLHARSVKFGGPKRAELAPDVVVWVGGPSHAFTEVTVAGDGSRAWALVPLERDATRFGLASIALDDEPQMDSPVSFLEYPNGIDLAPVAAATLCNGAYAAVVRPAFAAPRSPQELVLWSIRGGETTVIANAAGFAGVSLAAAPGGGLVVYVADGRTWARGLSCR